MEIKSGTIEFSVGTLERFVRRTFKFPRRVIEAHVALAGYQAQYSSDDHHVKRIAVRLSSPILDHADGTSDVFVDATLGLRDRNDDDPFFGSISFVLFVETEPRILPPIVGN